MNREEIKNEIIFLNIDLIRAIEWGEQEEVILIKSKITLLINQYLEKK
jgi:hypothetical protein